MRFTRVLAAGVLIAGAGLGLGACSAHPGEALITSQGTYSIEDVQASAHELTQLTGQTVQVSGVRSALQNSLVMSATARELGVNASPAQILALKTTWAAQGGDPNVATGAVTDAILDGLANQQQLQQLAQSDQEFATQGNAVLRAHMQSLNAQLNPRFPAPVQQAGQQATLPTFGDAVRADQLGAAAERQGSGSAER